MKKHNADRVRFLLHSSATLPGRRKVTVMRKKVILMKMEYTKPEMEITEFEEGDIVVTSACNPDDGFGTPVPM